MLAVTFSSHARFRCKQQGIGIKYVVSEVQKIPNWSGELAWTTAEGHRLVVYKHPDKNSAKVITVVGFEKMYKTATGRGKGRERSGKGLVFRPQRKFQR